MPGSMSTQSATSTGLPKPNMTALLQWKKESESAKTTTGATVSQVLKSRANATGWNQQPNRP